MNLNGPTLYQATHWWHWLTYGGGAQNAVALQTVTQMLTFVAALIAVIFSYFTYKSQREDLRITQDEQKATNKRAEEAQVRYDDERRALRRREWAIYTEKTAQEDIDRPRFELVSQYQQFINVRLKGRSAAIEVVFSSADRQRVYDTAKIINIDETWTIEVESEVLTADGLRVSFTSYLGSRWEIGLAIVEREDYMTAFEETILDVFRHYGPPTHSDRERQNKGL